MRISGREYSVLAVVAMSIGGAAAAILLIWGIVSLLLSISAQVRSGSLSLIVSLVAGSLGRWIASQAAALSVEPDAFFVGWTLAGGLSFSLAALGTVGGRIGWALFGLLTAAAAFSESAPSERWLVCCAIGLAWTVLSLPAFRRVDRRAPAPEVTPRDAESDNEATAEREPDPTELLAEVFQIRLRRRVALAQHTTPSTDVQHYSAIWTINGGAGHGFRAVPAVDVTLSREIVGMAYSPEAVAELLSAMNDPIGLVRLHWAREELRPSLGRDETDPSPSGFGGKPELSWEIEDFIDATPEAYTRVVEHFEALQNEPMYDSLQVRLDVQANMLNQIRPLLADIEYLRPEESSLRRDYTGGIEPWIEFNDWIGVRTIVKTHDLQWNTFGDHRPEIVELIARSLLRDDPLTTVRSRLTDDGYVHVTRVPGPAGPIHAVTTNGLHRTHAFALLEAPLIAARVTIDQLPLRIAPRRAAPRTPPDEQVRIWHGLIRRGLLQADFDAANGRHGHVELIPLWVAAPWLLLGADSAAYIAAAYDRVYRGALSQCGIPRDVLGNPVQWRRWLL
jgi:hypothetical protein